jgi:hypothetical protein
MIYFFWFCATVVIAALSVIATIFIFTMSVRAAISMFKF